MTVNNKVLITLKLITLLIWTLPQNGSKKVLTEDNFVGIESGNVDVDTSVGMERGSAELDSNVGMESGNAELDTNVRMESGSEQDSDSEGLYCMYQPAHKWSRCDYRTGKKTKVLRLHRYKSDNGCKITMMKTKDCKGGTRSVAKLEVSKRARLFSLSLYTELSKVSQGEMPDNVFLAPFSVNTALNMLLLGARGTTKNQLKKVLHYDGMSDKAIHVEYKRIWNKLFKGEHKFNYILRSANRLYEENSYSVLNTFVRDLDRYYYSTLVKADFKSNSFEWNHKINEWVSNQTAGKIRNPLSSGSPSQDTVLLLINTVYFKGEWQVQFESGKTSEELFYLENERGERSESIPVNMMSSDMKVRTVQLRQMKVLELPYTGREISMIILLPKQSASIADVERDLNDNTIQELLEKLSQQEASTYEVHLPRFQLKSKYQLMTYLQALGLTDFTNPRDQDFSGIDGTRRLYVSDIMHAATVTVDEKGTEAAASTAVQLLSRSASITPTFNVDRPFLFFIFDNKRGVPLFMGRVMRP